MTETLFQTFAPTQVRWKEGTKVKMSLDATDKKKGMSLAELNSHLETFSELARNNGKELDTVKITVMVNISGGVKQLIAEV